MRGLHDGVERGCLREVGVSRWEFGGRVSAKGGERKIDRQ